MRDRTEDAKRRSPGDGRRQRDAFDGSQNQSHQEIVDVTYDGKTPSQKPKYCGPQQ